MGTISAIADSTRTLTWLEAALSRAYFAIASKRVALRIGLVNKIFNQNELLPKSMEIAAKIASKPSAALRSAVKAVNAADEMSAKTGMQFEAGLFALCCGTEDFKEGTSAFLEKRKPNFKDR